MGLVEDDRCSFRKNACVRGACRLLFDGEVSEEEMVVDDDEVALDGPAAHLRDEAALEVRAGLAQARLSSGIEFGPERRRLRQNGQLSTVAGLGGLFPFGDLAVL